MSEHRDTMVRPWVRPHDWAEVVLGVLAALSPLVVATDMATAWTLVVLGVLIAVDGLVSLAMPGMVYGEGIQIVLGALLFIAPWVMGYSAMTGASWTSWVIGVLTVIAGAAAFPVASTAHNRMAGSH
ncbi:SPW repeat protein [Amycolatopsis suaedae]|nr:SPW repeat protein [Amycolatopsis suaedae]